MIFARNNSDVAVLIPIYKPKLSASEVFSIENTISILSCRDIYIIAPRKLAEWLNEYVIRFKEYNINVAFFDDKFFASIAGYNKLLMSSLLYKTFDQYQFILIVQTDALVFSDRLNEWMEKKYSYVGAPWFYGLHEPEKPLRFYGVGNGGLSLRRVSDFIRVLSGIRHIPDRLPGVKRKLLHSIVTLQYFRHDLLFAYNFRPLMPRVYEDLFWGILVPLQCSFFKVPTPIEAAAFSFEVAPEFLYELTRHELPFGCHAWEKYNYSFWKELLRSQNVSLP